MKRSPQRSGFLLIVVAGLMLLISALILVLLATARRDLAETNVVMQQAQCRLLLAAALNYIQEQSRIGYDVYNAGTDAYIRHEAMGWVDIRDGTVGPKDLNGVKLFNPTPVITVTRSTGLSELRPNWPAIGGVARCPMYLMARPPFAISSAVAPNPIDNQPNAANDPTQPITNQLFGLPLLRLPDPIPALQVSDPSLLYDQTTRTTPVAWGSAWRNGDRTPDYSMMPGWFRVMRDGPASFIISVGTGSTQGWRDQDELAQVATPGELALMGGNPSSFLTVKGYEMRRWWRVEWASAVGGVDISAGGNGRGITDYPIARSRGNNSPVVNQGGTFTFIQALRAEPDRY